MGTRNMLALGALALLTAWIPLESWADGTRIRAVVVEGDVLPDGTTLQTLVTACNTESPYRPCLALGAGGQLAYYGATGDGIEAVFNRRGVIVENGERLPDGSEIKIDATTFVGGLARGLRELAFPGVKTRNALFTPEGVVVEDRDTLPDGSTVTITFPGGLSLNARDTLAFHGTNTVFTPEGVAVTARQILPDGTEASAISFFGGLANSGFSERIAFHGFTRNEQAIFTQHGLVTKVGELPDGTHLQSINLLGGIATNPVGKVAFHGRTEGNDAVFDQHGLLARVGTRIGDHAELEAILADGGIAIGAGGTVFFHGVVGDRQAVLTPHGVVAKVGDPVSGGGHLEEIQAEGGVAVNFRGQVAFFGVTDGKPALFIAR